jgi:hypothetical protein
MEELPMSPTGILVDEDFITPEHEAELLRIFQEELEWPQDRVGRRSLHWGFTFCYKTFAVDKSIPYRPFPDWLVPLLPRTETREPDQVCLQHYPPGAGIPPHVDTHSAFDQLYTLSLGTPVMMQFREGEAAAGDRQRRTADFDLLPRSMMEMRGDARLHWTHGIRKRKTDMLPTGETRPRRDRWSISYRWLREGAICECGDQSLCDTAMARRGVGREYRWKQYEDKSESRDDEKSEEKQVP